MIGKIKIADFEIAKQITLDPYSNFNTIVSVLDPMSDEELFGYHNKLNSIYKDKYKYLYRFFYDFDDDDTPPHGDMEIFGPSINDAQFFIEEFTKLIEDNNIYNVLIHCFAGESRSTALGFLLLKLQKLDNWLAWEKLLKIRLCAEPNTRFLKHCDVILGTDMESFIKEQIKCLKLEIN